MKKTDCSAKSLYESLRFCPGENTLPGLRPEAYAIPKSQILKFPKRKTPADAGASLGSLVTYDGDFTLAADAKFFAVDIVTTASNLKAESQGEYPSSSFLVSVTLKYAGVDEEATGFCMMANTDDLVYVVRQKNGKYRVIGNDFERTTTKPSQDSGMAVTDASGTNLEVSVTDKSPAPFYTGKLVTEDGVIDCSTGLIEEAAGA
ncbi:hypothetical protein E4T81_05040 [Barnesiella sp. WM24]|uniref:hypothetical protein n=1 Tax=Barnesiella sp. WM24 TaxID=2558278 RepID=UPI0010728532|nr:hypothetical protein [Barnesiella sp. WM24]TFU93961.1 hypothetical protein E4T81_05040 [Barnesiella sp. WM24]